MNDLARRVLTALSMATLLAGCTSVVMNDGQTVVLEWDGTISSKADAQELATKSCREAGKQSAAEVNDVSTNPTLPAWVSTRRLTYRCS